MDVIAVITARGGSKGIPGKNLRAAGGKPLIAWTIEAALQSRMLSGVILSTDDAAIAGTGREWGAEVPFIRPAELAQDHSDHISVMAHALDWLKTAKQTTPDYVMLLQPTSPLRTTEDIDTAIHIAQERNADAVVSVCEADKHPYLCKSITEDGTLTDFVSADIVYLRRQDLPPAYALNGAIYLNRPEVLLRERTFTPPGTCAYIMPPERSLDVDTPWDLHVVDLILRDRNHTHEND